MKIQIDRGWLVKTAVAALSGLLATSAPGPTVARKDFSVAISVNPRNYYQSIDADLDQLKTIADTLYIAVGNYRSFQQKETKPLLDAAHAKGFKVVLRYYSLKVNDTSMEQVAQDFGNHPAVIGFKVQDEIGERGESIAYWADWLKQARTAIRKHSDKPIMVDVIPVDFWRPSRRDKVPASTNEAIDRYVNEKLVDWLEVSVGDSIEKLLPQVVQRWGKKATISLRTGANFKGNEYATSGTTPKHLEIISGRGRKAWENGASRVHFWTWKQGAYGMMDAGGKETPMFKTMQESYRWFRKP